MKKTSKGVIFCSFCGLEKGEVRKIFSNSNAANPSSICSFCVVSLRLGGISELSGGETLGEDVDVSITANREQFQIDKQLFKHLLKLALNSPDFASQITGVDVDSTSTTTDEVTMRLKPSVFFLRLGSALRACG